MVNEKYEIYCTSKAIEKAREHLLKRNRHDTRGIRFGLRGGGCSGFSIIFEFAEKISEKDHVFAFDDVSIYVDPKSMIYLQGATIDYEVGLMGNGFKFLVPSQKATCGCKESISF